MILIPTPSCPTVAAVKAAAVASQDRTRRDYLGASALGNPCSRAIWYEFNGYPKPDFDADTLWRFADGHRTEELLSERIRAVEGIQLWTHDENGNQFGFIAMGGKFKGHADGVIKGLLQSPKTPHVWEAKCVGDKGFAEFKKVKATFGDKATLKNWNDGYYAQAQLYMHYLKLDRHYLTVAKAGGRDLDACRTEYQPEMAEMLIDKADKIISSKTEPVRISEKKDFYRCRWCPFAVICHG